MVNDEAGPKSNTFTMSDTNGRLGSWNTAITKNDGTITESGIYYATISSSGSDTIKVSFSTSTRICGPFRLGNYRVYNSRTGHFVGLGFIGMLPCHFVHYWAEFIRACGGSSR